MCDLNCQNVFFSYKYEVDVTFCALLLLFFCCYVFVTGWTSKCRLCCKLEKKAFLESVLLRLFSDKGTSTQSQHVILQFLDSSCDSLVSTLVVFVERIEGDSQLLEMDPSSQ